MKILFRLQTKNQTFNELSLRVGIICRHFQINFDTLIYIDGEARFKSLKWRVMNYQLNEKAIPSWKIVDLLHLQKHSAIEVLFEILHSITKK